MVPKEKFKLFISMAILVVVVITFGGWIAYNTDTGKPDYYFEISKNMSVFGKVYEEITKRYVEIIDPEEFMQAGINGMLRTLDPYTVFIEREDNDELQIMTSGKYGGVGMRISKRDGWTTVVESPFEGTPAQKAGIREGDRIIQVDSASTKDLSVSETANLLRGKPGSEVFIKINRFGEENVLEFRLIRAEIKVEEISYTGFVKDKIGYIRLNHFSRNVGSQINEAIVRLKDQGMESLILDLRGNPGGLLEAAVAVADNFIEKGKIIVSRKGRTAESNEEYVSKNDPIWGVEPMVVLVDTFSASASEIVAGAIQDLDRGLIIGSPTFGKGLVQQVIPIGNETALKITTSKYYIPSGRLIQKPNFYNNAKVLLSYSDKESDSSKVYKTASGRTVKGNGGITPDIRIQPEKMPMIMQQMIMKSMFFNFSLEYATKHPDLPRNFEIDDQVIVEYTDFLEQKKFKYEREEEVKIAELEKMSTEEGFQEKASPAFTELKKMIEEEKVKDFNKNREDIKWYLKMEIAGKLWGSAAKSEVSFQRSPEIKKAVEILSNQDQYISLLQDRKSTN